MIGWLAGFACLARADDTVVPIPFVPPVQVPLFLKADLVSVRGTVKGDDCAGAVASALAAAGEQGTIVRLTVASDDLAVATEATCKRRQAGDTTSASVVDLTAVVITPGAPAEVYPAVSAERVVQVAALIGAVAGGGIVSAAIDDLGGRAWVRLGRIPLEGTLDRARHDDRERAVQVYEALVPAWVSTWARVLSNVPEVFGATLEVEVASEDPAVKRSRQVEIYRFAVPTANARVFLRGGTNDEQFLAATRVERAADPKRRDFEPVQIDLDDLEGVGDDAPSSGGPYRR